MTTEAFEVRVNCLVAVLLATLCAALVFCAGCDAVRAALPHALAATEAVLRAEAETATGQRAEDIATVLDYVEEAQRAAELEARMRELVAQESAAAKQAAEDAEAKSREAAEHAAEDARDAVALAEAYAAAGEASKRAKEASERAADASKRAGEALARVTELERVVQEMAAKLETADAGAGGS